VIGDVGQLKQDFKMIPGYKAIEEQYGQFHIHQFSDILYMEYDRYYDENREQYISNLLLILEKDDKKRIEIKFGNVYDLKISNFNQLIGFEIIDISDKKWERKNYHISDFENNDISGYSEFCEFCIPNSFH
jgi:hypothetical protein